MQQAVFGSIILIFEAKPKSNKFLEWGNSSENSSEKSDKITVGLRRMQYKKKCFFLTLFTAFFSLVFWVIKKHFFQYYILRNPTVILSLISLLFLSFLPVNLLSKKTTWPLYSSPGYLNSFTSIFERYSRILVS